MKNVPDETKNSTERMKRVHDALEAMGIDTSKREVIVSGETVISLKADAPTWMHKLAEVFSADPLGPHPTTVAESLPTVERTPVRPEIVAVYETANALAARAADFFDLPDDLRGGIESLHEMLGDLAYGPESDRAGEIKRCIEQNQAALAGAVETWLTHHEDSLAILAIELNDNRYVAGDPGGFTVRCCARARVGAPIDVGGGLIPVHVTLYDGDGHRHGHALIDGECAYRGPSAEWEIPF